MINVDVVSVANNPLPTPSKEDGDAGFDLRADISEPMLILPGDVTTVGLGFKYAIPEGHFGLVVPRSGLGTKGLVLANTVGIIDSSYRGEVKAGLMNRSSQPIVVYPGDRVCQMIIVPFLQCAMGQVDELDETERGEGGYGSTGVK